MSTSTRLAILGIIAAVFVTIGNDIIPWTDWSRTFQPASVGRLLVVLGGAIGGWVAGRQGNGDAALDVNAIAEAVREKLRGPKPPQ